MTMRLLLPDYALQRTLGVRNRRGRLRSDVISDWRRLTTRVLFASSVALLVCSTAWAGRLQDVSKADAPAAVQAGHRYTVRASIKQQGRLLFTTDRHYPVLDGDSKPLELLLVSTRGGAKLEPATEGISDLPASYEGELPGADSPLRGTYWKLVRLGDSPVASAAKQHEAHLVFADDTLRVAGSGGCNRVTGSFELDSDRLHIGRMAATMMACPEGMELEQRFLDTLEHVESYLIRGSHLEMLDAEGVVSARFEAVALK
jgi:heat shock protein HslJ